MQAIVDLIKQRTPTCFRHCDTVAQFIIWADRANDDGEHDDIEPLVACETHLADACTIKIVDH